MPPVLLFLKDGAQNCTNHDKEFRSCQNWRRLRKEKRVTATGNNNSGGGITFLGLLAIVFIVLKLTHVIDWKWIWVLGPIWIPAVIIVIVAVIIVFVKDRK